MKKGLKFLAITYERGAFPNKCLLVVAGNAVGCAIVNSPLPLTQNESLNDPSLKK